MTEEKEKAEMEAVNTSAPWDTKPEYHPLILYADGSAACGGSTYEEAKRKAEEEKAARGGRYEII